MMMSMMMMKVHYRLLKDTHSMNNQYKNVLIHYNILHVNKSVDLYNYYSSHYQHRKMIKLLIQSSCIL